MRDLKKNLLALAVAAALAGPRTGAAVSLSSDGLGDVLIYPYYTVRNGFDTYFSIINTSASDTKALKVRFRESLNGGPVFDFNLYLPPNDMWAGVITQTVDGARLTTTDSSCTTPTFVNTNNANFPNFYYNGQVTGVARDQGPQGLDRTREGFIEVFEMGVVPTGVTGGSGVDIVEAVRIGSNREPTNCAALQATALAPGGFSRYVLDLTGRLRAPSGGLSGSGYLVNSNAGLEFSYDAVALADFAAGASTGIWFTPWDVRPDYRSATPRDSVVLGRLSTPTGTQGPVQEIRDTGWSTGQDAVSALFMAQTVNNEYVLEPTTASLTEWVVQFPTKRHYVFPDVTVFSATAPFQRPFSAVTFNGVAGSASDDFDLRYYDRELRFRPQPPVGVCSTCPSFTPTSAALPSQTSVLEFGRAAPSAPQLLGSKTFNKLNVDAVFSNGWARMNFTTPTITAPIVTRTLTGPSHIYYGLPVVGFMLQTFTRNGLVVNGVPSTSGYGGLFPHTYERRITPRTP